LQKLAGGNQPNGDTATVLLAAIILSPPERLQETLLAMPGRDCAIALQWFVQQFGRAEQASIEFMSRLHGLCSLWLNGRPEVLEIMKTQAYDDRIAVPAVRADRNLKEKLAKNAIIKNAWGEEWLKHAEPCMSKLLAHGHG
jgi:hypothetical protein